MFKSLEDGSQVCKYYLLFKFSFFNIVWKFKNELLVMEKVFVVQDFMHSFHCGGTFSFSEEESHLQFLRRKKPPSVNQKKEATFSFSEERSRNVDSMMFSLSEYDRIELGMFH